MPRKPTAAARPLAIEFRPIEDLIPYARNARKHGDEQIAQLAGLIEEFGWTVPVLVETTGGIIAGHGRVSAAERLYEAGKTIRMMEGSAIPEGTVPVLVARGWTDAQVKAYVIADNKVATNSTWDEDLLRLELGEIRDLIGAGELTLELDDLGFSDADLGKLFADAEDDPKKEWGGMPEFDQQDKTAFRSIPVHFKDQAAVDAFAALVKQKITDKTRFIWFPEIEIETYADKRYVAEP